MTAITNDPSVQTTNASNTGVQNDSTDSVDDAAPTPDSSTDDAEKSDAKAGVDQMGDDTSGGGGAVAAVDGVAAIMPMLVEVLTKLVEVLQKLIEAVMQMVQGSVSGGGGKDDGTDVKGDNGDPIQDPTQDPTQMDPTQGKEDGSDVDAATGDEDVEQGEDKDPTQGDVEQSDDSDVDGEDGDKEDPEQGDPTQEDPEQSDDSETGADAGGEDKEDKEDPEQSDDSDVDAEDGDKEDPEQNPGQTDPTQTDPTQGDPTQTDVDADKGDPETTVTLQDWDNNGDGPNGSKGIILESSEGNKITVWGDPHVILDIDGVEEKFDIGYTAGEEDSSFETSSGAVISWDTSTEENGALHRIRNFAVEAAGDSDSASTFDGTSHMGDDAAMTGLTDADLREFAQFLRDHQGAWNEPLALSDAAKGAEQAAA